MILFSRLFHHAAHAAIDLAHHAVDLTTDLLSDEQNKDAKVEGKLITSKKL